MVGAFCGAAAVVQPTQLQATRTVLVAALAVQTLALVTRSVLNRHLEHNYGLAPRVAADSSYLVVPAVLVLVGAPLFTRAAAFLRALFACSLLTWKVVATGIALGLSLRLAWWAAVISHASLNVGGTAEPMFWFACQPAGQTLVYLLAMVALAPVIEEVINRGFVLHGLLRYGPGVALAGSSLLFGAIHPPGSIPAATLIGVVLGFAVLRSGALWASVIAHATYNALIALDWRCLHALWPATPPDSIWSQLWIVTVPVLLGSLLTIAWLIIRLAPAGTCPPVRRDTT